MTGYLVQPRDEGAEKMVLGSIISSRPAADDVAPLVEAGDFHIEQH